MELNQSGCDHIYEKFRHLTYSSHRFAGVELTVPSKVLLHGSGRPIIAMIIEKAVQCSNLLELPRSLFPETAALLVKLIEVRKE